VNRRWKGRSLKKGRGGFGQFETKQGTKELGFLNWREKEEERILTIKT